MNVVLLGPLGPTQMHNGKSDTDLMNKSLWLKHASKGICVAVSAHSQFITVIADTNRCGHTMLNHVYRHKCCCLLPPMTFIWYLQLFTYCTLTEITKTLVVQADQLCFWCFFNKNLFDINLLLQILETARNEYLPFISANTVPTIHN